MDKKNFIILAARLEEMLNDLNYLKELDEAQILTPEMKAYKQDIENWLSTLFLQIHDEVDKYMSTLPNTNKSGFIRELEEEGPQGMMRVLSNFQYLEPKYGKNDLGDASVNQARRQQSSTPTPTPRPTAEDYNERLENARLEGMAAGYFVLDNPENDVKTEEDYFNAPYEDNGVLPPQVDGNYSVTSDDIIDDYDESGDIPLF